MIVASDSYLKLSCFQARNRRLVGDRGDGTADSEVPASQGCLSALHFAFRQARAEAQLYIGGCFPSARAIPKNLCDLKGAGSESE